MNKGPTEAQRLKELQQQRSKLQAERARKASKLNTLKATNEEIQDALDALETNVSATTTRLNDAKAAAEAAANDLAAAQAQEAQAQSDLDQLRGSVRSQTVRAFVDGVDQIDLTITAHSDASDISARRAFIDFNNSRNLDSLEDFRTVQQRLATARQRANDASARATRHQEDVKNRLAELNAAHAQQERFAADVDKRIEAELSEADALSTVDSALSSQISSTQAALARRVAAARRTTGSTSGGTARTFATAGGAGIVSVQGIRVASSIASNLESLLNAAAADGINFGGGGYRDPGAQIAVRRSNCGSSNYAIYQMPASSCSPPTARPGSSMHEQGLAIDFTVGGSTLTRGSAGYSWLRANGARYGFYNLPSEPWHWSTNGN